MAATKGNVKFAAEGEREGKMLLFDAEPLGHFFVKESFARRVGLYPFSIDHKLRDGTFSGALDDLFCGSRSGFDIDIGIGQLMLVEKALGYTAVGTPRSGVDGQLHVPDRCGVVHSRCKPNGQSLLAPIFGVVNGFPLLSAIARDFDGLPNAISGKRSKRGAVEVRASTFVWDFA